MYTTLLENRRVLNKEFLLFIFFLGGLILYGTLDSWVQTKVGVLML